MARILQASILASLVGITIIQLQATYKNFTLDRLVRPLEVDNAFPLSLVNMEDGSSFSFEHCTVVILSNPNCPACQALAARVGEARDRELYRRIAWVSFSDSLVTSSFAAEFDLPMSIMKQVEKYTELRSRLHRLGIIGTPTRVIVDGGGTVRHIRVTQELPGGAEFSRLCQMK